MLFRSSTWSRAPGEDLPPPTASWGLKGYKTSGYVLLGLSIVRSRFCGATPSVGQICLHSELTWSRPLTCAYDIRVKKLEVAGVGRKEHAASRDLRVRWGVAEVLETDIKSHRVSRSSTLCCIARPRGFVRGSNAIESQRSIAKKSCTNLAGAS